jgi:hypothetical protein
MDPTADFFRQNGVFRLIPTNERATMRNFPVARGGGHVKSMGRIPGSIVLR